MKDARYGNISQTQLQSHTANSTSIDDCNVDDVVSIKVDQIVGIKNCKKVLNQDPDLDSIGIIRSWTHDHANVWIFKLNKTAKLNWRNLFFCVPWDHETNDYTFSFIQTLHSTQFFAMTSPSNYDWEPICDDYNELKQNINKSSQEIQVLLRNGKSKVLASYWEFHIYGNKQSIVRKIRLPSTIQKIPIVNSKQYWKTIIQMDSKIVNLACKIPDKIMMHIQKLQTIEFSKNSIHCDSQLHKIQTIGNCDALESSFKSKTQLQYFVDTIHTIKFSPIIIYLPNNFMMNKFGDDKKRNHYNCNENYIQQKDTVFNTSCIESLITGECGNQCDHLKDSYVCLERLIEKNDYKQGILMCEFILRRLSNSKCDCHNTQYPLLFKYILFEYSVMLYRYCVDNDWKDKDIMYLCHYYSSIFIAISSIDDDINLTPKRGIRLSIARGMLGHTYWKIGNVINDIQFVYAARINFKLCISDDGNKYAMIPDKFCMFYQHGKSIPNYYAHFHSSDICISMNDFLTYQAVCVRYTMYLDYLQSQERKHPCYLDRVVARRCGFILNAFGCSLDVRILKKIYMQLAINCKYIHDIAGELLHLQDMVDVIMGKWHQTMHSSSAAEKVLNDSLRVLVDRLNKATNSKQYTKIKLKIKSKLKTKTKNKTKTQPKITKEMIKGGKHLKNDPKLLLFAACHYSMLTFEKTVRNVHCINTKAVINIIKQSDIMTMDPNKICINLNHGKYLFELLKYFYDGNINLCDDREIKILYYWYYAQYYQIISNCHGIDNLPFESDEKYRQVYNQHIQMIINHYHSAFLELSKLKDKPKNQTLGSKMVINYINLLISIWDKQNMCNSTKNEIKLFWLKHFSPCNDKFINWLKESPIYDIIGVTHKTLSMITRNIDSMYLYTFCLFKMGNYNDAYDMFGAIAAEIERYRLHQHRCKSSSGYHELYRDPDRHRREYTFRNDYCLKIDTIIKSLQSTQWSTNRLHLSVNEMYNISNFPITGDSSLSRFAGFDGYCFAWLLSLFRMNCRGLQGKRLPFLEVTSNSLRQIRTSLFMLCMRWGNINDNYDRLYWLQFGMVSIGIQSLLWINCDKFKLNNDNYNYEKIQKYLFRFVIEYIESGLDFPLTTNKTVSKVAQLCLIMSYFVVGDSYREKLESIFSCSIFKNTLWDGVEVVEEFLMQDSKHWLDDNKRIAYFAKCMKKLQQSDIDADTLFTKAIESQTKICCVLNTKVNSDCVNKNFLKWKNAILKRDIHCNYCGNGTKDRDLFVCKQCKQAYYCDKKCQKMDWNKHKNVCSF